MVSDMKRRKKIIGTALLKVKCICHPINPESIPFEDYISSPNTSIKIDLFDGRSLMEKGFRSHEVPMEKFYIEFFDRYPTGDMMDYLMNSNSDFRVTSLDGTIIRLCQYDYDMIPKEIKNDVSEKPLKEYVFVKKKEGFISKIKHAIHKKDG